MLEWLTNALPYIISNVSVIAFILVFLAGVITSIGPCNLTMAPVIIAYIGGQEKIDQRKGFLLALFFILGSSTTFMLLGVIIALVGGIFGFAKSVLFYVAALICFGVGLSLLHVWSINLPGLTGLQKYFPRKKGIISSFLLGLIMGLAGSQCGTPILLAILSLVMLKGKIVYGALLLFFYGLGRGVPIVIAGALTGTIKSLPSFARWSYVFENVAGAILVIVGAYLLWIA